MKRIFYLFLIVLSFLSCNKKEDVTIETQKVTFSYKPVVERPMTKGINNDMIINWINQQLPLNIDIRLTDTNGNRYNIQTNSVVELPLGTYTVTGKSSPQASGYIIGSNIFFSNTYPSLIINTTLNVIASQTHYVVSATFGAFGIVIDPEETSSAKFESSHGEKGNIEFANTGTAKIVFINGSLETYSLDVTLTPVSNNDLETTYTFKEQTSSTSISPVFGNYYIIHPDKVSSISDGTFSYNVNDFHPVDIN